MKETDFLEKSRHFLKFGAIADLLECLIRLNNGEEEIRELREVKEISLASICCILQYLVEAKFIPKLISLLDQDVDIPIHENAADVFIDVLRYVSLLLNSFYFYRNLREMLTVTCEKSDSLHDVFLQETTVKEILQRMLKVIHFVFCYCKHSSFAEGRKWSENRKRSQSVARNEWYEYVIGHDRAERCRNYTKSIFGNRRSRYRKLDWWWARG